MHQVHTSVVQRFSFHLLPFGASSSHFSFFCLCCCAASASLRVDHINSASYGPPIIITNFVISLFLHFFFFRAFPIAFVPELLGSGLGKRVIVGSWVFLHHTWEATRGSGEGGRGVGGIERLIAGAALGCSSRRLWTDARSCFLFSLLCVVCVIFG